MQIQDDKILQLTMSQNQARSQLWGRVGSGTHKWAVPPRINGPVLHKPWQIIASPSLTQLLTLETFKSETSYKYVKIAHYTGQKFAFSCLPEVFCGPKICQKCVFGRGSSPDPYGGAHDTPLDLLVGWGGDTPPRPHPTQRRSSRLWCLPLVSPSPKPGAPCCFRAGYGPA